MNADAMKVKPPRTNKLTARYLEKLGACESEVARFRKLFPRGMELTAANVASAAEYELSVYWLVGRILEAKARLRFYEAFRENHRVALDKKVKAERAYDQKPTEEGWKRLHKKVDGYNTARLRANGRALARILGIK